jgi:hypothetical protein
MQFFTELKGKVELIFQFENGFSLHTVVSNTGRLTQIRAPATFPLIKNFMGKILPATLISSSMIAYVSIGMFLICSFFLPTHFCSFRRNYLQFI